MNKLWLFVLVIFCACNATQNIQTPTKTIESPVKIMQEKFELDYPVTRMDEVSDDYHGTIIEDPFRWLEDDHSEETKSWVKAQNKVTNAYLSQIDFKDKLITRLTELWNYPKYSLPFKEGGKYYFFKNNGLQNQSVMYSLETLDGNPIEVLDPNKFSEDGTTSLGGMSFNDKGNYLAYNTSEGGSDWRTIRVKDMTTGEVLPDEINWVKFSGMSWYKNGFFYSRYPAPDENDELSAKNEFHSLYYHTLGTSQEDDVQILKDDDHPNRNHYATTSDDQEYLVVSVVESTSGNALKVKKAGTKSKFKDIVSGFDNDFSFVDNVGSKLYFITNYKAPKQRLISIDFDNPQEENWKDIIVESEDALRGISVVGGKIFASYMHNASSLIKVFNLEGEFIQNLDLPGVGTVGGVSGKKDASEGFFTFTSFTQPTTSYKLNTKSLEYELFRASDVKFDPSLYTTEQIWYSSKDGTKVPMFVTYKKGMVKDGKRPTLLYGYGGFDIPILPSFSLTRLPILDNGGIYVVANIRGGGEFGSEWHKAGTLDRKQNVFDDFIAAAEYLVDEGYTSPEKLAIEGGSNGGLLVGACMTQRPDLFAVAFPRVGVLDMLRYHQFTIGWAWATDYGRSDDPEAFKYLIKYSPLHNVKEIEYPATMVMTADHDDRVVPAHSFKYISELQRKQQGENPVLIRIETSAGHGAGKPTDKQIEETADKLAFMFFNMNETVK